MWCVVFISFLLFSLSFRSLKKDKRNRKTTQLKDEVNSLFLFLCVFYNGSVKIGKGKEKRGTKYEESVVLKLMKENK